MPANLYALLVAINDYPSPVPGLRGCVNDIDAAEEYLRNRINAERFRLHVLTLKDEAATRGAVIAGFREHLCNAAREDHVLFYFSGHGSQEVSPPEFWNVEPDRLDETLVCWDSRTASGWDLADKELAKLISEVAARGPQISVVLDSCHSGSGTRGIFRETAVRRVPADQRQRPLDSFIFTREELEALAGGRDPARGQSGWLLPPQGRHLLFAACRDNQEAKEYFAEGKNRGVFSYFFLKALQGAGSALTSRDLMKWTTAFVRGHVSDQTPQLEAAEAEDLDRPFLGGAVEAPPSYFTVTHDGETGWVMDGGAVHGIQNPAGGETTLLALFPVDAEAAEMRQLSGALGQAAVVEVLPHLSRVEITVAEAADPRGAYKGLVVGLPLPAAGVSVEGNEAGVRLARAALSVSNAGKPSSYIREVGEGAQYRLLAVGGQYVITRTADARPLVARIDGYTDANAAQAVRRLEHLARWQNVADLDNPTSRIPADAVRVTIQHEGREVDDPELRLEYVYRDGKWVRPSFTLKLTNHWDERLYCALLALSPRYAVNPSFFPAGGVWLEPGQETWALQGRPIPASVPDDLYDAGITQVTDIVKLLVCTAEFDAWRLRQDKLDAPVTRGGARGAGRSAPCRSTLNRLMGRAVTRDLFEDEGEELYDDWRATKISITTTRPRDLVSLRAAFGAATLGFGVAVDAHPSLRAAARLGTVPQAGCDLGNMLLPAILREEPSLTSLVSFSQSWGGDPGLTILELTDVLNYESVTPESLLTVNLGQPLSADEHLLPVGFDGEFFLPLGYARAAGGETQVVLERLPSPLKEGHANARGSIRVLFPKIVDRLAGDRSHYPLLAVARFGADGGVSYDTDLSSVRDAVAHSERVLLLVPGVADDARTMAKALGECPPGKLVLAFEYRNSGSTLPEVASDLRERLRAAGIGETKPACVVAHSTGALVARWLVERGGGEKFVSQLVMLGPPNGGWPWPSLRSWATAALGCAMNGFHAPGRRSKALGGLMRTLEEDDFISSQIGFGSAFLEELARTETTAPPYVVIAGSMPAVASATGGGGGEDGPLKRMLRRLSAAGASDGAKLLGFFERPNDIAVSVESMTSLPPVRRAFTEVVKVTGDHLSYFEEGAGLECLRALLARPVR
jgi:hypothetical protein